jgi:hypothetical protein
MGEMKNAYKMLTGKPDGTTTFGGARGSWEDNIRIDRTEIGCEDGDWIHLTQDRGHWWAVVNTVMTLQVL